MTQAPTVIEGPGKGKAFFDRAKTVAESGNFDYAMDMYLEGLMREPTNVEEHEALRKVALTRKIKGGKPAGGFFGPKNPYAKGKTAKEQMLAAEWILARDPGNISAMQSMFRQAAAAEYIDMVRWAGSMLFQANKNNPQGAKQDIFLELSQTYDRLGDFKKATEAILAAVEMTPNDLELQSQAKELAAKETLVKGNFENNTSFKDSLKSKEKTKELLQEDQLQKTIEFRTKLAENARKDYELNPREHQLITKYAKTLMDLEDDQHDEIAIQVLQKAYDENKTYRYKQMIGEIKMRAMKRNVRMLAEAAKADPNDATLKKQLADLRKEQITLELAEYQELTANYPTDISYQYEYGKRLFAAHQFDEAIGVLQVAQNNPRHRPEALHYLGHCFRHKNMIPEAIDTFRRSLEAYEMAESGDMNSKKYNYWLARTLEDAAGADETQEAIQLYSKITQWDYNFADVRARLEALRKK